MVEQPGSAGPGPEPEPRRSRLGRILAEHPEARPRVRSAVFSLLATALATIAIVGLFLIWHLRRRARMIRERLAPPRRVSLPDLTAKDEEDHGTVASE
ncbi:hypothetical protein [Aquisphaera insulae]|uniref:hypothetical protein n=1 Tax=Aquisphaera insulae TaxID=2712864 RepID=UPI0013EB60C8|nr:hypothetical protein [Aquisphaera insulae]